MIDTTLVEMARRTDLRQLAGKSIELRRESSREWSGPCPVCGGTDRLHVKENGFFCRQCHPEFGDAIEFMRWLHRLDFAEAVQRLTGNISMTTAQPKIQPAPKAPRTTTQPPTWQAKAQPMVEAAQKRIEEATAYLESRSLDLLTALAFGLGYRPDAPLPGTWDAQAKRYAIDPQPAVVIPWYRGGRLCAVRHRFLQLHAYTDVDGQQRKAKLTSVPGSDFTGLLYGGHMLPAFCTMPVGDNGHCAEQLRTLVIVEGEINAMSIWQVAQRWQWDVLSLGSESQKLPDGGRILAERYGRTIIWMDKADIAKSIMAMIPGAVAISSPLVDGKKVDANDMLCSGQLSEFLSEVRLRACKSDDERERVKWDLWEVRHEQ